MLSSTLALAWNGVPSPVPSYEHLFVCGFFLFFYLFFSPFIILYISSTYIPCAMVEYDGFIMLCSGFEDTQKNNHDERRPLYARHDSPDPAHVRSRATWECPSRRDKCGPIEWNCAFMFCMADFLNRSTGRSLQCQVEHHVWDKKKILLF